MPQADNAPGQCVGVVNTMSSWLTVVITVFLLYYNEHSLVLMMRFPRLPRIFGPWDVALKEFFECADSKTRDDYLVEAQLNRNSIGETVIAVNVTLNKDYGLQESAVIAVHLWGNGGWKHLSTTRLKDTCKDLLNHVLLLEDIQQGLVDYFGLERNKYSSCPVDKGVYNGQNISLKNILQPIRRRFSALPYGKYKIKFENFSSGVKNTCLGIMLDIVPLT